MTRYKPKKDSLVQPQKDWKEHVEQDSQVSTFIITYAKKGNHWIRRWHLLQPNASDGHSYLKIILFQYN